MVLAKAIMFRPGWPGLLKMVNSHKPSALMVKLSLNGFEWICMVLLIVIQTNYEKGLIVPDIGVLLRFLMENI